MKGHGKMKKIVCLCGVLAILLSCGCRKKSENLGEKKFEPTEKMEEAVSGNDKTLPLVDVTENDLVDKIKSVNKDAEISKSSQSGMKMLKVDLPVQKDEDFMRNFFTQVSKIVKNTNLEKNSDYDYFYFSSSDESGVLVAAAFNKKDGKLKLDSVVGIPEEYKSAAEEASKVSDIFK